MTSLAFLCGCYFAMWLNRRPIRTTRLKYTTHDGYSVSNDYGHVRTVRAGQ